MLNIYTGENRLLADALIEKLGRALAAQDNTQYIIVPKQLTLLTERLLISGLRLRGSFRMRVLSPARLCSLIFDETGLPAATRIDERGRVMLVRAMLQQSADQLTIYKNAHRRRGFCEKCARQLELFMQGGVSGDDLRNCLETASGLGRMRLQDLALLLDLYNERLGGEYQDGESELILAAGRIAQSRLVGEGHFWFFGFDLTPPTLTALMAGIAAHGEADAFIALENDGMRRDYDCYKPMERALGRLINACREAGAETARHGLGGDHPDGELGLLARELYAYPVQKYDQRPAHIRLRLARDPREECMAAAATARKMAMSGLRYGEMQLICFDLESYRPLLIEAFQSYAVPLFLSGSRPVSRMAIAECLLSALRLIEKNFCSEDLLSLTRTGYMDISRDEMDRLANYALRRGVDRGRWLRPLNRGEAAEIEEMEPLRQRLMEPIKNLRDELRGAENLRMQLASLVHFLENINAYQKSLDMQSALKEQDLRQAANELGQAWNRIMGALDQMAALLGDGKLPLRELTQTLREALEAAAIKALPQSGDAVYAQAAGRMLMQKNKLLMILGMADRGASGDEGLLSNAQRKLVCENTGAYLGPDESDSARMRRYYLKSALGMAEGEVCLSYPMSGVDGGALRPDMTVALIREIFPEIEEEGGVNGLSSLLACAPRPAAAMVGGAISKMREGGDILPGDGRAAAALRQVAGRLPDVKHSLRRMGALLSGKNSGVDPDSARALYGKMQAMSITRLERFANCPFSYFANYGLKPRRVEPFELDRRDEGNFLHGAVYEFLKQSGDALNDMSGDEAERSMGIIADRMLDTLRTGTPMEDSAAVRAEGRALRAAACRCARVLAGHMRGSKFHTEQLERAFGREDGMLRLRAGDTTIEGRIDRVDSYPEGNSLRVIDFKLGGKALNLGGVYHGLQLQLPVYLGAAMKQKKARSAGVYYFALDEGIADIQSTDRFEVEKMRADSFRMSGLLPEDMELISAMSPEPDKVFKARFTKENKLYANIPCADDVNFNRLIRHTLRMAQMQIDAIKAGTTAVSPVNFENREPCAYCDYRAACLFDSKTDAASVRRLKSLKWNEVFEQIALEDGE